MIDATTLKACLHQAKTAATNAAAWAEAADLFPHNAPVAARFAALAERAARPAREAATLAVQVAGQAKGHKSAETVNAEAMAARTQTYADTAALTAAYAAERAKAARPFVPASGPRSDLERARQAAYYAWVTCPDPDGSAYLEVLRAYVEEAEAAVQAALLVPALA
ncbi:MAG TPA: hypothetical protein VKT82_15445 [Ktedonobacterales bacterium]|nr:hypothetical protein [Ktedonobacterales bacterium]